LSNLPGRHAPAFDIRFRVGSYWQGYRSFLPKPPPQWQDGDRDVIFYPFLVILERDGTERAAWLPYFHVVRSGKKTVRKYGQWAPFMSIGLFEDLLRQAHEAGYLPGVSVD